MMRSCKLETGGQVVAPAQRGGLTCACTGGASGQLSQPPALYPGCPTLVPLLRVLDSFRGRRVSVDPARKRASALEPASGGPCTQACPRQSRCWLRCGRLASISCSRHRRRLNVRAAVQRPRPICVCSCLLFRCSAMGLRWSTPSDSRRMAEPRRAALSPAASLPAELLHLIFSTTEHNRWTYHLDPVLSFEERLRAEVRLSHLAATASSAGCTSTHGPELRCPSAALPRRWCASTGVPHWLPCPAATLTWTSTQPLATPSVFQTSPRQRRRQQNARRLGGHVRLPHALPRLTRSGCSCGTALQPLQR